MNDISNYLKVRHQMCAGDVIVFAGNKPISHAITIFGGSDLTHCGVVRHGVDGAMDVQMSECTIEKGKNGAQTNLLGETLANYGDGARAWWLPLTNELHSRMDWIGFYAAIGAGDGIVRYSVGGLFAYLVRSIPVIGPRVLQGEDEKQMVCSAWVTHVLKGGGILRGVNQDMTKPIDVARMNIYREATQLIGHPSVIERFNTI